jgi:hypothetical protein
MCVFDDTNRSAVYYAITGSKVKQLEKLIRAGCDLRFFKKSHCYFITLKS